MAFRVAALAGRLAGNAVGELRPFRIGGQVPAVGAGVQGCGKVVQVAVSVHLGGVVVGGVPERGVGALSVAGSDGVPVAVVGGAQVFRCPALGADVDGGVHIAVGVFHFRARRLCGPCCQECCHECRYDHSVDCCHIVEVKMVVANAFALQQPSGKGTTFFRKQCALKKLEKCKKIPDLVLEKCKKLYLCSGD